MEIFDNYLQVKSNDTFDDSSDVVQLFRRVAGVDMEIDWVELQNVLNTSFQRGKYSRFFYLPMCKLLYRFCMPFTWDHWCCCVVDLIPQLMVRSVSSVCVSAMASLFRFAIQFDFLFVVEFRIPLI